MQIANRKSQIVPVRFALGALRFARAPARGGFTLVETIVGVAVFLVIALGIYASYTRLSEAVRLSRARVHALAIANDDLELIRNLPYQDIGISGGLPSGKLSRTASASRASFAFAITRTIRNIDDPFDGTIGGTPNDTAPADYKLVEVEVNCLNCPSFAPVRLTSTAAPAGLELSTGGGALFIRVIDANGIGVPQAAVHIENTKLTPNLIIDEFTNNQGILQLVDVPQSVGGYHIFVTKPGYSSDQTYPPAEPANPNPVKTDSTVLAGQVTQATFAIDRVSAINLSTVNQVCAAEANADLRVDGTKLIGTNPDVLKYSQNITTDVNGQATLSNLEWDTYNFTVTDPAFDLGGSIPLLPLSLAPNTSQDLKLIMNSKSPKSVLVTVKDGQTNLSVSGANVTLSRVGFSAQALTGRGAINQTDWSGGPGQAGFVDPSRYWNSDGNIDIGPPSGELKLVKIGPTYVGFGWLESSTFDLGSQSDFHNISWIPSDQPPQTGPDSVKFQAAANNDNATWNFVGPDNTALSFYTLANTNLSNLNGKRYFRYRVYLSTQDSSKTPNVSDIAFTFTSACVPPGQVLFSGLAGGTYTLTVTHPNYQSWSDDGVQVSADFQQREALLNP